MEDKSISVEVEKLSDAGIDDFVVMEKRRRVEWLDLPKELWAVIGEHVSANDNSKNTTFEIHWFRSVCKAWRSAHPSPPRPFAPQVGYPEVDDFFCQTKIYRLEPLSHRPHTGPDSQPSNSPSKGWIIMLEQSNSAPLCLLNPFTRSIVSYSNFPMVLNLINFRAVELVETLFICSPDYSLVVSPKVLNVQDSVTCALYNDGTLSLYKMDQSSLVNTDAGNGDYHDIILHKGRVFAVDRLGTLFWINPSSLMMEPCSDSLDWLLSAKQKHMVSCGKSLYVVDMQIQEECFPENVDVQVYELIEDDGRWVDVENLGDTLFVLGKDSNFSLSAEDYYGCHGNSVYFSHGDKVFCFSLEDSKLISSPNPF